ncbi:MAG: 50S ribosomal protein L11 methyltransferase [Alphaproteobacteria bacterium]|nr:50S ribosomal protein L11 methyltransferase [Alphaproteobacteria bacterium]
MSAGAVWKVECVVPAAAADSVAGALADIVDALAVFEVGGPRTMRVRGYGGGSLDAATECALNAAVAACAQQAGIETPAVHIVWLPAIDWLAENQASFAPISVGRFWVHDSAHRAGIPPGSVAIEVDAATAFGTGEHATTKGCLAAIDRLARLRWRGLAPATLDMGCGTAILSIAAAHALGARVLAVDIDADSVRVARTNLRINRADGRVRAVAGDGYRTPAVRKNVPYGLILANVLAGPLIRMAGPCAAMLAPGGIAVLSGLLDHQAQAVFAAHRARGLVLAGSDSREGWTTLTLRKP